MEDSTSWGWEGGSGGEACKHEGLNMHARFPRKNYALWLASMAGQRGR